MGFEWFEVILQQSKFVLKDQDLKGHVKLQLLMETEHIEQGIRLVHCCIYMVVQCYCCKRRICHAALCCTSHQSGWRQTLNVEQ
jgi:hypothetical protein